MNKRQWKKKYKKIHGYNPPTIKQVNQYIILCKKSIETYKKCAEQVNEGFIKMAETIKGFANSISTMQVTKCTYPNKVCANMTLLNGIAYCDSVSCCLKDEIPKQTNADRIRNMTNEELSDFLCSIETYDEGATMTIGNGVAMCSVSEVEEWLESECEGK